jgi:hypothetical protein
MRRSSLLIMRLMLITLSAGMGLARAQSAPANLNAQPAIDTTPQPLSRLIKLELSKQANQTTQASNQAASGYTVLLEDQMTKMLKKTAFAARASQFPNLETTQLVAKTSTRQVFNQGCKRIVIHVSPINALNDPQKQLNIAMNVCPDGQAPSDQMPDAHAARFYNQHPIPQLPKVLPR